MPRRSKRRARAAPRRRRRVRHKRADAAATSGEDAQRRCRVVCGEESASQHSVANVTNPPLVGSAAAA